MSCRKMSGGNYTQIRTYNKHCLNQYSVDCTEEKRRECVTGTTYSDLTTTCLLWGIDTVSGNLSLEQNKDNKKKKALLVVDVEIKKYTTSKVCVLVR